jgi:hypothetical protein
VRNPRRPEAFRNSTPIKNAEAGVSTRSIRHWRIRSLSHICVKWAGESTGTAPHYFAVGLKYRKSGGCCPCLTGIRKPSPLT